jgi:hypothetical protein
METKRDDAPEIMLSLFFLSYHDVLIPTQTLVRFDRFFSNVIVFSFMVIGTLNQDHILKKNILS